MIREGINKMKLIKKQNNKKGFTLIELVIVIAILAILALILIPAMSGYIGSADKSKDQADARSIFTAASIVVAEENPTVSQELDSANLDKVIEKANIDLKDKAKIVVKVDEKGTVERIFYTNPKGKVTEFDGKTFDPKKSN